MATIAITEIEKTFGELVKNANEIVHEAKGITKPNQWWLQNIMNELHDMDFKIAFMNESQQVDYLSEHLLDMMDAMMSNGDRYETVKAIYCKVHAYYFATLMNY